jgi:hypothetical protein
MGLNRWSLFVAVVAVLIGVAALSTLWPDPIPQVRCDDTDLFATKTVETIALGQVVHRRLMHVTAVGVLLVVTLFYFQIFHWIAGRYATVAAGSLALAIIIGAGFAWVHTAERWAGAQSPSCLAEALEDAATAPQVAWSNVLFDHVLPSVEMPRWPWLLRLDAAALAVTAVLAGWLLYLLARRTLRL